MFRLRRDTGGLDGQRTGKHIVYGITSMPAELAGPVHLNHYEREHWCVEVRHEVALCESANRNGGSNIDG